MKHREQTRSRGHSTLQGGYQYYKKIQTADKEGDACSTGLQAPHTLERTV